MGRKRDKMMQQGVRVEGKPLRRWKICNVNLEMRWLAYKIFFSHFWRLKFHTKATFSYEINAYSHLETEVISNNNMFYLLLKSQAVKAMTFVKDERTTLGRDSSG